MEGKANGIEIGGGQLPGIAIVAPERGLMPLHQSMPLKAGRNDEAGPGTVGKNPSHTAQLRSSFKLAETKSSMLCCAG